MSPLCRGFHTPSPMRCSTPLIDSQSPLLPVNPVLVIGPSVKGLLSPAVCQIYRGILLLQVSSNHERFLLMHRQSILITPHET